MPRTNLKPVSIHWNPGVYGALVAEILALAENGERLMPLAEGSCCSAEALRRIQVSKDLFASSRAPRAALAGLYLYFSCRDEAHEVAQSDSSVEGSYWHAIVHRQEPDPANSAYWFRKAGPHPVFAKLSAEAADCGYPSSLAWDPFAFVEFCESARQRAGSKEERIAMMVQRLEWQLLFDHCVRGSGC